MTKIFSCISSADAPYVSKHRPAERGDVCFAASKSDFCLRFLYKPAPAVLKRGLCVRIFRLGTLEQSLFFLKTAPCIRQPSQNHQDSNGFSQLTASGQRTPVSMCFTATGSYRISTCFPGHSGYYHNILWLDGQAGIFKYALLWKKYTRNNPVCTNRIPLKAPLTACIRSFS